MPSFSSSSSIRAASEQCLLNVKIVHKLYHCSPSQVVHKVKGRLPKELDVLLLSDLIFSISGSLDGQTVLADAIAHSALMRHLRNELSEARIETAFFSNFLT
jgi:predicted nicotinamide N-methyase